MRSHLMRAWAAGAVEDPTNANSCSKGQIAMRISLANVIFFTMMLVLTLGCVRLGSYLGRSLTRDYEI